MVKMAEMNFPSNEDTPKLLTSLPLSAQMLKAEEEEGNRVGER